MADRTTYHAGQGGTGKNGPAQSGVGGIRGGGTAGQTDNTGGGRQMNGHYSGQNRKQNYRKGQNRNRLGGGHQRGGMMQQVPSHFAHQQYHDQSHYGPYGQHYGVPVHYGLPVQNQYHQYQMQPQHHVIRNSSPMQQQQAQQPPPSVQQQTAPSQTGVATPVTVAPHQQQGQQQQSPHQQQQQQQAVQPSTPNNISNSQSPNQIQPTEIEDATGSTNSGTPQVQRTQYPQVIHDYNGGMQHTGQEYAQQNPYMYQPQAFFPQNLSYPSDPQNPQQHMFQQPYQQYQTHMYHPQHQFVHHPQTAYIAQYQDQNQSMVSANQQQYQYFHPQQVQQPAQYYTTPTQIDPNGIVITNTQMLPPHSQIPQAPPSQPMTAQQATTAQQQTTSSSPRQHISSQQQPNTPTSMTSSPSVPVQTVPKPAQVNPTPLPTQTTPIGQIQNPVMLIPGLPSIVNGKQPEALQSSDQQKTEVLEISETVPEVVPELVTPVTGPVTELVTEPVTELVTTTEIEEKLTEMVLQNGASEIEEKEDIEENKVEEVTEIEKIEDVKEKEPEEVEVKQEEEYKEQKGTFEFNVPDIDDDSNDELMLTEVTSIDKLCFIVNNKEDDDREIPTLSDEEAEMLKMGNRTFSEYSRCVQKNKIDEGQKTEQTCLPDNENELQLDKSLEFINSALEKESEDIPNVSFGVEEVQEDKIEVTEVNVAKETKVDETKEVEVPKVIGKELAEEKIENLKRSGETKKEERVILEEVKKEEVSPQPKIEEKSSSFIKAMRQGQVVSPVVSPVVVQKSRPSLRKSISKNEEILRESKSSSSSVHQTSSTSVSSSTSLPSVQPSLSVPTPTSVPPFSSAPPAKQTWASMMKAKQTAQAAAKQAPVNKPTTAAQSEPRAEKKEIQIEVDPIAKKITDIIYSEDNSATELGIPRGLINHANNCWVNSLLQTALVCDPLYKLLKKLLFYTKSATPSGGKNEMEIAKIGTEIKRMLPTCAKLAEVFGEILHQKDAQRMAYEPTGVYDRISELNSDLAEGQHDAEEALSLLLNAMHDEIVTVRKAAGQTQKTVITDTEQASPGAMASGDAGEWKTTTKSGRVMKSSVTCSSEPFDQSSPISEGFRGLSHSSIKIQGNHSSPPPTEQPFFTLQLDVASPLSRDIHDVIKNIPKEENLEDYKLKDGTVIHANRKMSLARLPPILILHMKRFLYNATTNRVEKLDKHITIKERIEIPRECLSPGLRDKVKKNPRYELNGLVLHHGIGAEGGHYTAETKRNNKWFKVDDNKVNEVKISDVINCDPKRTPYLLFYKKVQ